MTHTHFREGSSSRPGFDPHGSKLTLYTGFILTVISVDMGHIFLNYIVGSR
jgi:hypothetical protein